MRANTSGSCAVNLHSSVTVAPGSIGAGRVSSATVSSGPVGTSLPTSSLLPSWTESTWIQPQAFVDACAVRSSPCELRMNRVESFLNAFR